MSRKLSEWDKLKRKGSSHYKTPGGVEPIDLYKSVKPHPSLNALEVKALTDIIKYAFRMVQKGINESDMGKISHYTALAEVSHREGLLTAQGKEDT